MSDETPKTTTITGEVTSANERGVKLDRGEKWINRSQYGTGKNLVMPAKGLRVTLILDKDGYIQEIHPAEPAPAGPSGEPAPQGAPAQSSYAIKDRTTCREWAVYAAQLFYGAGPGSDAGRSWQNEIMALADRLAAWAPSGEPWVPLPVEPSRKPAAPSGGAQDSPQAERAPAPARAASPGTMAAGSHAAGSTPVFTPPPREPQMPEVERQADDDQPATQQSIKALHLLRESVGMSAETMHAVAASSLGWRVGRQPTRRMVRVLATYLAGLVPAEEA